MPRQVSEDGARDIPATWLGPTGAWRWPFDATYREWALGAGAAMAAFVLAWLVLPLGVLIVAAGFAFGSWWVARARLATLTRTFRTREPRTARRRARWTAAGLVVALVVLLAPSPRLWLMPMRWWMALPLALWCGARFVRWIRPWVDGNRPVPYWTRTLLAVAAGPRTARKPLTFGADGLSAVETADLGSDHAAINDFWSAVHALDAKEFIVHTYREIGPEVEAMLWDSTTGRPETCEHVIAWLQAHGATVQISKITERHDGRRVRVEAFIPGSGASGPLWLEDGHVITLDPNIDRQADPRSGVGTTHRSEFGRRFLATHLIGQHPKTLAAQAERAAVDQETA